MKLAHGGNLAAAMARYGGTREHWIDLSTGIAPEGWPVPSLPAGVWQRLPEEGDQLRDIAARYYRCQPQRLLPLPGSQHAISLLPRLWPRGEVALPYWGYREHQRAWAAAGHGCHYYRDLDELAGLLADPMLRYAVLINPNNPTAELSEPARLLPMLDVLATRGGYLLVDEAFVDLYPDYSLGAHAHPALVVLRSVGKFFGLAGLRLGFAIAEPGVLAALDGATEPWALSHPARWVGAQALADESWQVRQRDTLSASAAHWQ
ncbi:MAG: threonine-phosphate decarboxylase, partial [Parahaliea sp.]